MGGPVVTVGNVHADKLGSMWLTGTDAVVLNSTDGCWGATWFGLMIRVDVGELVMGTVRGGTDAAETPIGELVRGPRWGTFGTGRVLGSVCGTLEVSISPSVTSVVVMTASVIAGFSKIGGEGTVM